MGHRKMHIMDKNLFEVNSKLDQLNKDISGRFENLNEDVIARFESINSKISCGFENLEFLNPNLIQSKENQGNLSRNEYQNLKEDSNKSDQSKSCKSKDPS